jgi:hypothetical protein
VPSFLPEQTFLGARSTYFSVSSISCHAPSGSARD